VLASSTADVANSAYLWIYILIGLVTLLGSGGAVGLYRAAKKQGVRDQQFDLVIKAVLPDENGKGGLTNRLSALDRQLDEIKHEQKPNGGNTQRLGDIAKRSEGKIDALSTKLDQHIGQSTEVHADIRRGQESLDRRIVALERRSA
jgi:hypothetical protein